MRRVHARRILSLVLAAELLCTPLAIARAEDPANVREEIPLGEEVRPVQTVTEDRPIADDFITDVVIPSLSGGSRADSSATVLTLGDSAELAQAPTLVENNELYNLAFSFGKSVSRDNVVQIYDNKLQQESDMVGWGSVSGTSTKGTKESAKKAIARGRNAEGDYLYFLLPDMGRLPDWELEGFYLHLGQERWETGKPSLAPWLSDNTALHSWSYEEGHPENYVALELEEVTGAVDETIAALHLKSLAGNSATAQTLVRFPISQLMDNNGDPLTGADGKPLLYYVPGDGEIEGGGSTGLDMWSIPIVARWTPSRDSDMTLFTLNIPTAGTVKPVTELYTDPKGTLSFPAEETYQSGSYRTAEGEFVQRTVEHPFLPGVTDGAEQHYYLWVDEDQSSIDLRFWTNEPYYAYHRDEAVEGGNNPVSVTATYTDQNGRAQDVPFDLVSGWGDDGQGMTPPAWAYGTTFVPQNSVSAPARGQWTVENIQLKAVSETRAETDPFNTVTVTIDALDGIGRSTYVFHIERRMEPQASLAYGNTPAGMIMRDSSSEWTDSIDWGTDSADMDKTDLAAYNKASAIKRFNRTYSLRDIPLTQWGAENQSGAIYKGTYDVGAWAWSGNTNPDLSKTTMVLYQDMAADDPGVSFVDTEGRGVKFGDEAKGTAYETAVTRTLKLASTTSGKLTAASYGAGVDRWYDGTDQLSNIEVSQTLRSPKEAVDLRGLNVLPGDYEAIYIFNDPVYNGGAGHTHTKWNKSADGSYELCGDGNCGAVKITRRVIVLPVPGDVDMDGAVTAADALALTSYGDSWNQSAQSTAPANKIYRILRYRIYGMPLSNDSQGRSLSSDAIRDGFQPVLGAKGYSDYMYLPLSYSGDDSRHDRHSWAELNTGATGTYKLRLDFLGIEQGEWQRLNGEVFYNTVSGPWNSPQTNGANPGVSIVPNNDTATRGQGDVFWVGVYIDPGEMTGGATQYIQDLSLSLVYDSNYVTPALVHVRGAGSSHEPGNDAWRQTTLFKYNFTDAGTLFSGKKVADYTFSSSVMNRSYATHYSKVEGDLELAYTELGQLDSDSLREVVFSLQGKTGSTASWAEMKAGYLLVLPFQLTSHPGTRVMQGANRAQLVELSAGMRDFSIVLSSSARSISAADQGLFSLFDAQPLAVGNGQTYAFSAQDDIYGGTTRNIRSYMTYNSAGDLIPIGEDKTQRTVLPTSGKNPIYDQAIQAINLGFIGKRLTGDFPPGLDYDPDTGVISGTPARAGTYYFSIGDKPYQITVEPRTITYRAVATSSFYGEREYRGRAGSTERATGDGVRDFTFTYDRADLAPRDRAAAEKLIALGWAATDDKDNTLRGSGDELALILGREDYVSDTLLDTSYKAPTFYARDNENALRAVGQKTSIEKYNIVPDSAPESTNYKFEYDYSSAGHLTIESRPVWVDHLVIPANRSGSYIYNDQTGQGLDLTIAERTGEELFVLTFDPVPTDNGTSYDERPLTGSARVAGDTLTLRFGANYTYTDDDKKFQAQQGASPTYRFQLTGNSAQRELEVTQLGNSFSNTNNYNLMNLAPLQVEDHNDVWGTVVRRGITAIEFSRYPTVLQRNNNNPNSLKQQAYYGDKVDDEALYVKIIRGAVEDDEHNPLPDEVDSERVYNATQLTALGIHYNWVSPADRNAGVAEGPEGGLAYTGCELVNGELKDKKQYNGTDILTPDMDGWYVCAVVEKFDSVTGKITYIKTYSEYPVRVAKRTLTLTAQSQTRYYGEDNSDLTYTYLYSELIPEDQAKLTAWLIGEGESGKAARTREELEGFFGTPAAEGGLGDPEFKAPTLVAAAARAIPSAGSTLVDRNTPVGGYYVVLHGAQSAYYDFVYTNQAESTGVSTSFGYSGLTILQRPIVVTDIYSRVDAEGNGYTDKFETIYADTKTLKLQNQVATADRVSFALPEQSGEDYTYFYRYGSTGARVDYPYGYKNPEAVVTDKNGVPDDLEIHYSVRFMCDPGHYAWYGFDNNYYDVSALAEAGGSMQKDVVIADMTLEGADADNYILVYNQFSRATERLPDNVEFKNIYPDPDHLGALSGFYIHGTGTVTLRQVKYLEFQELGGGEESVGQTVYIYGDTYAPYSSDSLTGTAMTVVVRYDTAEDDRHLELGYVTGEKQNITAETVTYSVSGGVSTFEQRGFVIYYLKEGQTRDEAIALGQILDHNTLLSPSEHNGAQLFVVGKRRAEDPEIQGEPSAATLVVRPRTLNITVKNAHRFYGETLHVNDGEVLADDLIGADYFIYTFPISQLALRDQQELARLKGLTSVSALPATGTQADLQLLADEGWITGLKEPTFSSDPGPKAELNKDSWGEYPIQVTQENLDDYVVTTQSGTLYVYPRPIRVEDVLSSPEDPVYTIYNKTNIITFTSQLDTDKVVLWRRNIFTLPNQTDPVDGKVSPQVCSDAKERSLPLQGDALVGDDSLIFTVRLTFAGDWDLAEGETDIARQQVEIDFRSLKANEVSKNYVVDFPTFQKYFWGAVKLRTIDEIFITGMPTLKGYTYGDVLDLSDLQVTIRYKALQGTVDTNTVSYLGPDSFRAAGLYVNYWDPDDAIPGGSKPNADQKGNKTSDTTTDQEDLDRRALPNRYRRADSGDHLTIAPTHDTQRYIANPSTTNPLERPFAANGKYILISACQDGEEQVAATPKLVGASVVTSGGTSYEGAPVAIEVKPLQLTYDLSAQDKTYDGTTQAAGTLTLNNVFDRRNVQTQVVETARDDGTVLYDVRTDQVRDVVYIPLGVTLGGEDYQDAGYDNYRNALTNGVVAFTTGLYQPAEDGPLGDNGALIWADNYTWGDGLTFTFANPNVHYLEEDESQGAPRGIGTADLAEYWTANQMENGVAGQWDYYGAIGAMPVEVTGMVLAGPDAANYTWATDGTAQDETQVTMTTRAGAEAGQAAAPYATIRKANRDTIQLMAGANLILPYLQLDEHTNVVRLFHTQALADMGDNHNIDPTDGQATEDDYRDELHFEYALYYEGEDGLMTQWAGPTGQKAYQDTTFFGGELVHLPVDPDYVPDYSRMDLEADAKEGYALKGQRYRWAEEDTGVSEAGYREDAGIVRDWDAYPGGAEMAQDYYVWYYDLYTWGEDGMARQALPRNTVFYPLVRLSETHNYNASACLTGDEDVSAHQLNEAQAAVQLAAGDTDGTLTAQAKTKSEAVFKAAQAMEQAALKLSRDRVELDAALAAASKLPEESRELIGSAPAVKTFQQRLDIISPSRERSTTGGGNTEYLVQILEDVWFTDTLKYPDVKNMDAVVYNEPRRYYSYFWDVDTSAQIKFGDTEMPVDFDTVMTVQIRQRQADGTIVEMSYTYDPLTTNHTAPIYVTTSPVNGGHTVRGIRIIPDVLYARLGDPTFQLQVVTDPVMPTNRRYTWSTSDPSVVTVDQSGLLTFRGVGMATITVTTTNGRSATATVFVTDPAATPQLGDSLFNYHYQGPWMSLDSDYAFRPYDGMTRGELVMLLDIFLNPSAQWQATQELAYVDVTGREKYYEALKRLTGAGVVEGIPGGSFAGDQLATRAEFVAMLSRMLELNIIDTKGMTHAFADVDETSTWAYAYIDALAKTGAIRGVGGGTFAPNRQITREETAAIISRLLIAKLDETRTDLIRPSDMTPENWSYAAVLRAINTVAFPD